MAPFSCFTKNAEQKEENFMSPLTFNPNNEPIDLQNKGTKKPLFIPTSDIQTTTSTYIPTEEKTSTASYFLSSLSESARKFTAGGFKGLFSKEKVPTWKEAGKQFAQTAIESNKMKGTVMLNGQQREINAFNPIAILSGEPLQSVGLKKLAPQAKNLTTKFLDYVQGKLTKNPDATLSRQEILDFAKRPELKKGEADLLNLKIKDFEGQKISGQDFADSIRRDLLELKPVKVKEPQYERISIDKYDVDSPIPTKARTKPSNYEEAVFESPITTNGSSHYPNSKNYFAHARGDEVVEGGKKIWREQEIQSDLLQKEGMENQFKYGAVNQVIPENEFVSRGLTKEAGLRHNLMAQKEVEGLVKQKEQLTPFTNDRFGERIMRERIKEKASKGYEKYRLPTGETIGKIEGFHPDQWRRTSDFQYLRNPDELKVGMEIDRGTGRRVGEDWIITDILGDGRFKAVEKHYWDAKQALGAENRNLADFSHREETFDLTGKSNPQYRRYENWGKFLKNKFGGKEITDLQGNKWVEIDLRKEYKDQPIPAFGKSTIGTLLGGAIATGGAVVAKPLFTESGTTFEYQANSQEQEQIPKIKKETKDIHGTYYELDTGTTIRPVSEKYTNAIEQAYNLSPTIDKGVLEAILMKESSMGKNASNKNHSIGKYAYLVGFTRIAKQELIRNGIVPDLDTPEGAIKAAAQFWDLRDNKYENATSTYNHHYSSGKLTPEQLKEFDDMVKYYGSQ